MLSAVWKIIGLNPTTPIPLARRIWPVRKTPAFFFASFD